MRQILADIGRHRGLVAVTVFQAVCAVLFLVDVLGELDEFVSNPIHPLVEFTAIAALLIGSGLGALEIRRLIRQNRDLRGRMRAASGAFVELMQESFGRWGLTRSERDVALLTVKGLSVAEIAALRETREGTVRAQCAAIYRKAGVESRAQLLSLFVEDLMAGVVLEAPADPTPKPPAAVGDRPRET